MSDIIIRFTEEEFELLTSVTMFSSSSSDLLKQLELVVQKGKPKTEDGNGMKEGIIK